MGCASLLRTHGMWKLPRCYAGPDTSISQASMVLLAVTAPNILAVANQLLLVVMFLESAICVIANFAVITNSVPE